MSAHEHTGNPCSVCGILLFQADGPLLNWNFLPWTSGMDPAPESWTIPGEGAVIRPRQPCPGCGATDRLLVATFEDRKPDGTLVPICGECRKGREQATQSTLMAHWFPQQTEYSMREATLEGLKEGVWYDYMSSMFLESVALSLFSCDVEAVVLVERYEIFDDLGREACELAGRISAQFAKRMTYCLGGGETAWADDVITVHVDRYDPDRKAILYWDQDVSDCGIGIFRTKETPAEIAAHLLQHGTSFEPGHDHQGENGRPARFCLLPEVPSLSFWGHGK